MDGWGDVKGTLLCSKTKYKWKICFQKVQTWCICTGPHPKSSKCCGVDDKILTKKVRVKTSHIIFGYVHFHFIGWDFATFNIKNF